MLGVGERPLVDELLSVDREYRHRASRGDRIVHTTRGGRQWTALYSTSALARQFGRAGDWVVLDLEVAGPNPRWTVVTERRGPLKGKRVVRGREVECFRLYRSRQDRRRARSRRSPLYTPQITACGGQSASNPRSSRQPAPT